MSEGGSEKKQPKLVNRHEHKKSTFVAGRTIGEKREHLETKRERVAAREKDKRKNRIRIIAVTLSFVALIAILIVLARIFWPAPPVEPTMVEPEPIVTAEPTIEIVDESANSTDGKITSRMSNYIGLLELDLKSYGITPIKAVLPRSSIREIRIFLDGYTGYLKVTIDRGSGVTAEDADRMLRYLQGQGITDFEYIDLRIDGRAFWKEKSADSAPIPETIPESTQESTPDSVPEE